VCSPFSRYFSDFLISSLLYISIIYRKEITPVDSTLDYFGNNGAGGDWCSLLTASHRRRGNTTRSPILWSIPRLKPSSVTVTNQTRLRNDHNHSTAAHSPLYIRPLSRSVGRSVVSKWCPLIRTHYGLDFYVTFLLQLSQFCVDITLAMTMLFSQQTMLAEKAMCILHRVWVRN